MKLSLALLSVAAIVGSTEAKLQGTQLAQDDRQARKLGWCFYGFGPGCDDDDDDDDDDEPPSEFIGNCKLVQDTYSGVDGEWIVASTGYDLTPEITFTYPCSGGYLRNFAANENLLEDVRDALNQAGHDLGVDADCANLCDIDNGSYETTAASGTGTIAELEDGVGELFCEDGVLAANSAAGFDATNPCACTDDYIAGCGHCSGTVRFKVKTCADTSSA